MQQIATAISSTVMSVIACKSARDLSADSACVIYINLCKKTAQFIQTL